MYLLGRVKMNKHVLFRIYRIHGHLPISLAISKMNNYIEGNNEFTLYHPYLGYSSFYTFMPMCFGYTK